MKDNLETFVNYRDFVRQFKKYKNEPVLHVKSKGRIIGVWYAIPQDLSDEDLEITEAPKEQVEKFEKDLDQSIKQRIKGVAGIRGHSLSEAIEESKEMRDVTPVNDLRATLLPNAASEKFKDILGVPEETEEEVDEDITGNPECFLCRGESTGVEQTEFVYDSGDERRFYMCARCAKSKGIKLLR